MASLAYQVAAAVDEVDPALVDGEVDDLHDGSLEIEEIRDWANLVEDAVREIGDKLLAMDASEYIRLRAVCKPWRSSTTDPRTSWEPRFFPRDWKMMHEDEDDEDAVPDEPAARRPRRFVNVRTGDWLWIDLPSFQELGGLLADDTEGLLLFCRERTDTMLLFNPLTTATALLPGFAGMPEVEGVPELTASGIVVERRRITAPAPPGGQEQEAIVVAVPNVVLVVVSRLAATTTTPAAGPRQRTVILCAKPGDEHWGTVDAGGVEAVAGGAEPFVGGLSLHGRFYVPTCAGDVLRVELGCPEEQPRLVYVARPPGRTRCRCGVHVVTSYLVPSLEDDDDDATNGNAGENDDVTMLLVRVFADDQQTDVVRVDLGNGRYRLLYYLENRTIFLPGLTVVTDRFPALVEQAEDDDEGCVVHLNAHIEDFLGEPLIS